MAQRWRILLNVGCVLLLTAGCRTAQPELKPTTEAEVLRSPPSEARFNSGGYPKQAFNTDDPTKKGLGLGNQPIMPTRGGMGAGGPGMR